MKNFSVFYLFLLACFQATNVEVSGGWDRWWDCLDGCTQKPKPDKTPPTFSYCPSDKNVDPDRNRRGAYVSWGTPRATDDRGGHVSIELITSRSKGSFFSAGVTYTIQYTASDEANNRAHCLFEVRVRVVECSRKGGNGVSCTNDGRIYGTTCTLNCNYPRYTLVGRGSISCQLNGRWSASLGYCQDSSDKMPHVLQAPKKGFLKR